MVVSLGFDPEHLQVILMPGASFAAILRDKDGDFPAGATIWLAFKLRDGTTTTWNATITGPLASWQVAPNLINSLLADHPVKASLWYGEGGSTVAWATGDVQVES